MILKETCTRCGKKLISFPGSNPKTQWVTCDNSSCVLFRQPCDVATRTDSGESRRIKPITLRENRVEIAKWNMNDIEVLA
jgi:ssDNA-binding Zn-finger/Zn-ribbon topoisomerase 1